MTDLRSKINKCLKELKKQVEKRNWLYLEPLLMMFDWDGVCAQVCKGPQQHEEVCLGLFTLLLTEPPQAQRVC